MSCNHPKGITCPKCNAKMSLTHTRQSDSKTLRYRACQCGVRVVTREVQIKVRMPKG